MLYISVGAAGFTAGGVVAGSAAATAQGYFYGACTTGVFSALQSAGELKTFILYLYRMCGL